MSVVLVGLIGATLISEPALVGATRGGLATMQAGLQGTLRPIPDTPGIFDLPITVATMPIGGVAGEVVAQNDVDILGEFGEPATR